MKIHIFDQSVKTPYLSGKFLVTEFWAKVLLVNQMAVFPNPSDLGTNSWIIDFSIIIQLRKPKSSWKFGFGVVRNQKLI